MFFSAKFDPPSIVKIVAGSGCLKVNWITSQQQTWMKNYKLNLELRLRAADSGQWPEQLVSTIPCCYSRLCLAVQAWRSDLVSLLLERFSITWFDQPNLWASVLLPVELSIRPRCECGTRRAPGASGAAASPESPWRAVKVTVTLTLSYVLLFLPFTGLFNIC